VTEQSVPKEDTVLKPSEEALKPCADLAQPLTEALAKSAPHFHETVRGRGTLENHRRKLYYQYLASKLCCVRQSLCVRKPG